MNAMKGNFDRFLLGLLWLMTIALALTFWMNIRYGFNVLSAAHWQYLSTLQAARAAIKPEFYISLVVGIFVGVFGMYILVRPHSEPKQQDAKPEKQPAPTNIYAPTTSARPMPPSGLRSNVARPQNRTSQTVVRNTALPIPAPKTIENDNTLAKDISTVFESNGYSTKPCKKLGRLSNPVITLGYDNTVWVGTSNTSVADVQDAIQTLITIFDDTLGDTANDMSVHGCLVNPSDSENNNPDLISTFATIEEFADFMRQHQNEKPADFDAELFEAVSTYITTVIGYAGKS